MVSTRQQKKEALEKAERLQLHIEPDENKADEDDGPVQSFSKSSQKKKSLQSLRKQRKEILPSKNLELIRIDKTKPQSQKIVFADDDIIVDTNKETDRDKAVEQEEGLISSKEGQVEAETEVKDSKTSQKKKSTQSLRKQRKEALQSKTLGLVRIDETKPQSPKIVFADDDIVVDTNRETDGDKAVEQEEILISSKQVQVEAETEEKKSKSSQKKKSSKRLRKQRKESLRSKNLGLIRIDETKPQSQKIVFADDDIMVDTNEETDGDKAVEQEEVLISSKQVQAEAETEDNEEEDIDNAVEQMDSKAARDMALAQLQRERETKATQTINKKKKRKARPEKKPKGDSKEEDNDDGDDGLEENFFAELDAQKSALKRAKKSKTEAIIPKHTVFQAYEKELISPIPVQGHSYMQLVVLGEDEDLTAPLSLTITAEPSQSVLYHSRVIEDGSDVISPKERQKERKGRKPQEPNWKRSQKMNRLLKGRGGVAPIFAVQKALKTFKF